jgi:hypothetical protein
MIRGRDFLIVVALFFLLLYNLIGDNECEVWSFFYFQSIFIIINRLAKFHPNKYIRLGLIVYSWVLSFYAFFEHILKIPVLDYLTTVVFILIFSVLAILTSRNNTYRSGFFKH